MLRLFTVIIGLATMMATLVASVIIDQPERLASSGGFRVFSAIVFLIPLLGATVAPWSGIRTLRVINAVTALHFVGLTCLVLLGAATDSLTGNQVPWLLTSTAAPVAAGLMAWGWRAAWAILIGTTAIIEAIRYLVGRHPETAISNDVQAFAAAAALLLLCSTLLEAGRALDRSAAAAHEAARRRSEEDARASARATMQALVHDEMLATLVLAGQDSPLLRDAVAAQATRASGLLRDLREPDALDALTPDEVVASLRQVVRETAPDAVVTLADERRIPTASAPIDAEAAEALRGALRQALTNSRTHAGPEARRSVAITLRPGLVRVEAHDDGVGFDPARVAPTRLGVATSILGRLAAVPGGTASVDSAPGRGTTVTLTWVASRSESPAPAESAAPGVHVLDPHSSRHRRGMLTAIGIYLLAQTVLAVLAASRTDSPAVPMLALAVLAAGFAGLGWTSLDRPTRPRAALAIGATVALALISLLPVRRDPETYGDLWYLAGAAFLLLAVAVRGRPRMALVGGLASAAIAIVGAQIQQNDPADVLAATTRATSVLIVGVLFVLAIVRLQQRARLLRAEELAAVRASAFTEVTRRELRERSRALEDTIGELLDRLASGEPLSPAERRECVALEGRLRDQHRGGRLARGPLVPAAMEARRRGVDVVLIDDSPDHELSEDELDQIAEWMAGRLAEATEGRFTGRILPAGRRAVASVVSGEEVAELPARAAATRDPEAGSSSVRVEVPGH